MRFLFEYVAYDFSFQLMFPVHLMSVILANFLCLNFLYVILGSLYLLQALQWDAVYYSLTSICAVLSLVLGLSVRTYFKPI